MSLTKYEVLIMVAETGNLTRVAESLGYTQSGISHIIGSLEEEFGFPLLFRNHNGVTLTDNCKKILPSVRNMIASKNQMREVAASINGIITGDIRIAAIDSIAIAWMPRILSRFLEKYPGINFKIITGTSASIYRAFQNGQIDIGFLSIPPPPDFSNITLVKEQMIAVLPQGHPLCSYDKLSGEMLKEYPFIEQQNHSYTNQVLSKLDSKPTIKMSVSSSSCVTAMVEEKLGITIMPELRFQTTPIRNVVTRELDPAVFRFLYMGFHSVAQSTPALRRFMTNVMLWLYDEYQGEVEYKLDSIEY